MRRAAILLVREADAAAGWRFRLVRFGNRITALCRGRLRPRFAFRTAAEWQAELADLGFDVSVAPMGTGPGRPTSCWWLAGSRLSRRRRPETASRDRTIPGVRGLADARLELIGERLRRLLHRRVAIDVMRHVDRRPGRTRNRPDGSRTTEQGSSGAPVM